MNQLIGIQMIVQGLSKSGSILKKTDGFTFQVWIAPHRNIAYRELQCPGLTSIA
jgi:hypothetical protein